MSVDVDLRTTALGFAGAAVVLAILVGVVGVDSVVSALSAADLPRVVAAFVLGFVWLAAWGMALWTVLGALGSSVSPRRSVFVFAAATFANNVTPFGQAGGEPVSALFIARSTEVEYERGLAAIASVDSLNFVPGITLSVLGVGYFATSVAFGRRLTFVAAAVGVLVLVVPVAAYVGWRNRYDLERRAVATLIPVVDRVAGAVPGWTPPDEGAVERRIEGFFHAIERVATDRERIALALGFSALGWAIQAAALWVSIFALGVTVSVASVLLAVPVAAIAGITPLPGGLGGVEAVLVGLLVATTLLTPVGAAAAVIIYRVGTYWLPTLAGGVAAGLIGGGALEFDADVP